MRSKKKSKINNQEFTNEIIAYQETGRASERLFELVTEIVTRMSVFGEWSDPKYNAIRDEMIERTIDSTMDNVHDWFDHTKGHAFRYTATVVWVSFKKITAEAGLYNE